MRLHLVETARRDRVVNDDGPMRGRVRDERLTHGTGDDDFAVYRKVQVDSMSGFLFVNLDKDAPSLEETVLGVAAEFGAIALDTAERKLTWRRTHLIQAN